MEVFEEVERWGAMCRSVRSQEDARSAAGRGVFYSLLCCPFVSSFPLMHLWSSSSDEFYLQSRGNSRGNKSSLRLLYMN